MWHAAVPVAAASVAAVVVAFEAKDARQTSVASAPTPTLAIKQTSPRCLEHGGAA